MAVSALHAAVNTADTPSSHASLPDGSCNFRPLTSSSRAPTCGCRKFWLDKPLSGQDGSSSAYCACGHHACFHDTVTDVNPPFSTLRHSSAPSIPSEREYRRSGLLAGPPIRPLQSPRPRRSQIPTQPTPQNIWGGLNDFARWQQDPTWIPSTAPPSIMSCEPKVEPRNALKESQLNNKSISTERPYASLFPDMEHLMASPTIQGTPTTEEFDRSSLRADAAKNHCGEQNVDRSTQSEPPIPTDIDPTVNKPSENNSVSDHMAHSTSKSQETPMTPTKNKALTPDVQNILRSCVRRLEELESLSFSHVPVEEVQDKFELFDGRLLDMEYWRKDIDAQLRNSKKALVNTSSTSSMNSAAHESESALASRVSEVESRLYELEAAQPSYAYPWEIEVVLLPFGRSLKGIWHTSMDTDTKQSPISPAEQTGELDSTGGLLALSRSKDAAWTADTIQAWADDINPWLWPKAPGPNSLVFKRLKSRGFVRTVTLTETGAYGIWEAIKAAFAEFVEMPAYHSNHQDQTYAALQEPFVPLRKVRKSPWLRYLGPHDLVTPSSWDVPFLNSGVFMHGKGGLKRLYLTTGDAYVQSGMTGWTWQQIRELPCEEPETVDANALPRRGSQSEPFWNHTVFLDEESHANSFASNCSFHDERRNNYVTFASNPALNSPSVQSYTSSSSEDTVTPRYSESFPIISRKPSQSKRRNSPSCTPIAYQKRRRTSNSPGFRGRPEELTPRWSHEPPTPMKDNPWETRSQCIAAPSRKRLSTPTAYATPHSNHITNVFLAMADGGDTEVGSLGSDAMDSEREWTGLDEEDDYNLTSHPSSHTSYTGSVWMESDDESSGQYDDESDDSDSSYKP